MVQTDWWRWREGKDPFPPARVESVNAYLKRVLGQDPETPPPMGHPTVGPSAVDLSTWKDVGHIDGTGGARLSHSVGRSYEDLLSLRRGHVPAVTDAVIFPTTNQEVQALLRHASTEDIAVVPWGGGTSVVGGVSPLRGGHRGIVTLSLEHMRKPLSLDKVSLLGRFQCGILGPELEAYLATHGLTLGHFPQSFELSTLGGWIATRSSGQASSLYGDAASRVRGALLISPEGQISWDSPTEESEGPKLEDLFIGNEGTLGVFTEVTLGLFRAPEVQLYRGALFPDWDTGVQALRELAQGDPTPAVLRVSDPEETALTLAGREKGSALGHILEKGYLGVKGWDLQKSSLSIIGFDVKKDQLRSAKDALSRVLRSHGGLDLGSGTGEAWKRERFRLPSLRDDLMDSGWMVETLETGTRWENISKLHDGVLSAIRERAAKGEFPVLAGAHLSHAAISGACLYVTMIAPQPSNQDEEPLKGLKAAATEAILRLGGSLSHHHGVGSLHRPFVSRRTGPLERRLLTSAKSLLDPARVLNPDKTLPTEEK